MGRSYNASSANFDALHAHGTAAGRHCHAFIPLPEGRGPVRSGMSQQDVLGHAQRDLGGQGPNQAITLTGPPPATTNGQSQ